MTALRRGSLLVTVAMVLLALIADRCAADSCPELCPEGIGSPTIWQSRIIIDNSQSPFGINLTWTEFSSDAVYIVQYRDKDSADMYETITNVNGTSAEVTGLQSQSQYEVRVCLQSNATNCGECVRCFETIPANEPPSSPRNVMAEGTNPQSITVTFLPPTIWNTLGLINYNLTYQAIENSSVSFVQFESNVGHNEERMEVRLIEDLEEDTTYVITVNAVNEFGSSPPTNPVQATTKAFTNDPGALVVANSSNLIYYQVNDLTINDADVLLPTQADLHTFSAAVQGISYHLYRPSLANESEVYVSLNSGEIRKLRVAVTKDENDVTLSVIGNDTLVYNTMEGSDLGRVSVDWVNNLLYWVELEGGASTINRLSLDGGELEQVGMPESGEIKDIFPDPVNGFFYWLVVDLHLSRVTMSDILSATESTDLSSLPSRKILFNSTASPFPSTFTIDLSDLNLFYVGIHSVFLISLTGTQSQKFILGDNILLDHVSSYRNYGISYLTSGFIVLTEMVMPNASATDGPGLSLFTLAALPSSPTSPFMVTAVSMFRESLQPLPEPPTVPGQIRVKTTTDSVNVSWNAPEFFGSFRGEGAFSAWEYEVIYSAINNTLINDTSSFAKTNKTNLLYLIITDLMPGTTYQFEVRVSGPGGSLTTPSMAFTTMSVTNEVLQLLVAAEPGVFQTNLIGEAMYIQRGFSDRSNGTVYDSYSETYFWVTDSTAGGNLFVSNNEEDTALLPILEGRNNPFALSLDWIGRNLYWVEGESNKLVTVSLSNISDEAVQEFASEEFITDIAVDSLNGLVFWTSNVGIQARTINGLFSLECTNVTGSRALAVDASRRRLYYLTVDKDEVVTLGQMEYTNESCSLSKVEHILSKFSLRFSSTISMVYAADTLFFTQYSSTIIYFVLADLAAVNPNTTILAIGEVKPVLEVFIPMQFRDLFVILTESQPLPANLTVDMLGDVAPDTPLPQPMDNGSSSTVIEISWQPVTLDFSPIFYTVEYTLNRPNGTIVSGKMTTIETMLTLPGQIFYTEVLLILRAYSLWQEANATSSSSFRLPPAVPGKVQNVRVYVFFPHRNSSSVSGQVVWDGLSSLDAGGVVDKYVITVTNSDGLLITSWNVIGVNNSWAGPPFEVDGEQTEFSLAIFGESNALFYPLFPNENYSVDVFAMNIAGNGERSDVVTFNTADASPPLEVLQIGSGGGTVVRDGSSYSSPVTLPAAVNSVNRLVYYVSNSQVSRISLDSNAQPQFLSDIPPDLAPLALTYDWLGESLFIAARSVEGLYILRKVSANLSAAFPPSEIYQGNSSISNNLLTSVIVNPFTGFLYWTLTDTGSNELFQLDLRDGSVMSLLQSSRRRRDLLSSLMPTSALALDPVTNRLWICDQLSGNILSCPTSMSVVDCQVEVNASALGNGASGLPADSIALDEQRVYWSSDANPTTVYYALRNDSSSFSTLTSSSAGSAIFTLSPGQQPLPQAEENMYKQVVETCLTPVFDPQHVDMLVQVEVVSRTNTSICVRWDEPTIPPSCSDVVFSYPPLQYTVVVRLEMTDHVAGSPITISEPMYTIAGLEPYTEYDIQVAAFNQYTSTMLTQFGPEIDVFTREGVPLPVELQTMTYGPRHIYLYWDRLNQTSLRGNESNQCFIVEIVEQNSTQKQASTYLHAEELYPSTQFTFKVQVSNGVLESMPDVVVGTTLPRPPSPTQVNVSNTSLTCTVLFDDSHVGVTQFTVNISDHEIQNSMSQSFNGTGSYDFTFSELLPFVNYSLVTEAQYETVMASDGTLLGPVKDTSEPTFIQTQEGVPDAPNASVIGDILSWTVPDDNGRPIMRYLVYYDTDTEMRQEIPGVNLETVLMLNMSLTDNAEYRLTVAASNSVGQGPDSSPVNYVVNNDPFAIIGGIAGLIGICVGGVLLLVLPFLCLLICCCYLVSNRSKSVTLGTDYELNRLRALAAHSHSSANPHYMWSRDDYKCTDEDMEELTKFPRNKLRLETFIDRGEFGEVYQGSAHDILGPGTGPTPVAVKTLRKGSTSEEHMKFLSEASLMSQFNHQNIVKVLGVCIDNDPFYIIMELMPAGDLLKFLREARRDHGPALLTLPELVQAALDVAQGCRYLEQQHFIHRDIAARNCLVSSKGADRVVKIADFGLAKDLYSSDYYQVEGQRKLPVRWMAPEALLQGKFVIESDIWSYGVLLWEIMTLGNQPYPGRNNQEVLQFVTGGGRLEKPENCPGRLYKLMTLCWKKYGSERIHFAQIVEVLVRFLENAHNRNRDSYYSDDDSDIETNFERQPSRSSRTPSLRSGLMSIARQGSRLRNSFRRRSLHRKDFENPSQNSEEQFIGEGNQHYRERGPF